MSNDAVNINVKVKLKPFQKKILDKGFDFSERYLVVMANRQCGKSFSLKLLSLLYMCKESNKMVGYVTLTQRLGRQFYSDMLKIIPKQIIKKANSVELIIELCNGSSMHFWSVENIAVCRGFSVNYLIFDEVAFSREETSDGQNIFKNILSPMLDAHGRKVIFASTPFAKTGLFYEAYNRSVSGEKGWGNVIKTIYDEKEECGVDDEWIEEKRKLIGNSAFAMEYECKFKSFEELSYFKGFEDLFINSPKVMPKNAWFGIDFSSVGEDRTVVTRIDEQNNVTQWNIIGNLDAKYQQIVSILNEHEKTIVECLYESNSIGEVMSNQIRKQLKASVRSKFKPIATTTKTKPDMVQNLSRMIEKQDIHFDINNRALLEEMGTFVAKINENTKYVSFEALEGHHDDYVMSLAICCYGKSQKTQASTPFIVVK